MPGGDRTGPAGMGPMTGRAAGFCAGYSIPGMANPVAGRGFGFGRGRGFFSRQGFGAYAGFGRGLGRGFRGGWGWGVPDAAPAYPCGTTIPPYGVSQGAAPTPQQETDGLKEQAEYLEDMLESIRTRIADLEAKTEEKK